MMSLLVKEKLYIGEVVLGTGFGVIIGPHCAGIFDPRSWGSTTEEQNKITLEIMRVVLATGLFAIGVELPKAYLAEHVRSLMIMVVPTMALGWLICAGIIHALFPALSFVSSLAISACLTPTDPILAAAIIGGKFAIKNVPGHVRRLLSAESAANDGLAYPFLSISIYLAVESSKRVAIGKWFLVGWLYQVILGIVLGSVLGLAFSYIMKISHRNGLIDRESFVAQYLALAIFTVGVANTIGSDDLLAAFAAGSAVSWDGHFNTHTEDEVFSSVIDLVFNCACFIYIGAWLPFDRYNAISLGLEPWRLVVLFIAILVLRRIPSLLMLYKFIPDVHNWREALFCGHFGPMGVGAIFISTLAVTELPEPSDPPASQNELLAATLHPIVSFVVLCSIMIHGLSISAFWFGRNVHARTVSLSVTVSRTWTLRNGAKGETQPDWLLFARHATGPHPSGTASLDDRVFSASSVPSPSELEHGASLPKDPIPTVVVDGSENNDSPSLRLPKEHMLGTMSSCPGSPRIDSRVESQATFTLDSEPSSSAKIQEPSTGEDEEENKVHVKTDAKEDVVGYESASLHNAQENDRSLARETREGKTETVEMSEVRAPHTASATNQGTNKQGQMSVMKQVQFAQ